MRLERVLEFKPLCTDDSLNLRDQSLDWEKCTFDAKNFILRLSRSISSHFDAIHSQDVCRSAKSQKITKTLISRIHGHSRHRR